MLLISNEQYKANQNKSLKDMQNSIQKLPRKVLLRGKLSNTKLIYILQSKYTIINETISSEMNKPQVIQILSDHEEQEYFNKEKVKIIQKHIEDEANLCNSKTGLLLAVNKQFIPGTPEQKKLILAQRISKMFIEKQNFDISQDYFCIKKEPNYNLPSCDLVLNQLMVYGSDFWPSRTIQKDAKVLNIQVKVITIDDSNKKLIFPSFEIAKKWLEFYLKDSNLLKMKMQEGSQIQSQEDSQKKKLKGWFSLSDYLYMTFQRKRQVRFCTNYQKDIKQLVQGSKINNFLKFKQKIQNQLLKNEAAKISYQMANERNRRNASRKKNKSFLKCQINKSYRQGDRSYRQRESYKDHDSHKQRQSDKYRDKRRDQMYGQRSRNKNPYRDQKYEESQSNTYSRRYNRSQMILNRTGILSNLRQNRTNFLDPILNEQPSPHDDSYNLQFLLENQMADDANNVSLSYAMNKMALQENNNISVQLEPRISTQNASNEPLNLSIVFSEPKNTEELNISQQSQQGRVQIDMGFQSFKKRSIQDTSRNDQKQRKRDRTKQKNQKERQIRHKQISKKQKRQKKHESFDYLSYLEKSQKNQIKVSLFKSHEPKQKSNQDRMNMQ